jgi:hypothetical protein
MPPFVLGVSAVACLAAFHWLLIGLATVGAFRFWFLATPLLGAAVGCAIVTVVRLSAIDRLSVAMLTLVGLLLYLPPAEGLALTGDAAIYLTEGITIARTGGLTTVHAPLAALPPETRTLFTITADEQFPGGAFQSYAGMVYRSYYIADAATATIATSRMPLTMVWFAFIYRVAGVAVALYSTPLFALLALLVLYATARRLMAWPRALLVTLLLAVSYTQIYFGRISYAEIYGQFWTVAGILTALYWIERRTPWLLVATCFFWATTWAGRIDALFLLPTTALLLIYAGLARDRRTLSAVAGSLPVLALLVILGTNQAYVSATVEILYRRWPWLSWALVAALLLLPVVTWIAWQWGRPLQRLLQWIAPALHGIVFALTTFVVLWATLPNPLRDATVTRSFQEIIWFSSAYVTPLFYWLVLLGIGRLLWQGYDSKTFWLLATFYSMGIFFLSSYTSARVYPVSLRRLVSDLLPLMTLLVGMALAAPTPGATQGMGWLTTLLAVIRPIWQWSRWVIMLVAIGWMAFLGRPLWTIHEGVGTIAVLEEIQAALPADAVLIFEDQDSDSWVAWLAAPLYARYGAWTLILDGDTPEPALWQQATAALMATGRPVYVVTQQADLPPTLQPAGYRAILERQISWQSTLIGQTRAPYPPPIWDFAHPLKFYRLAVE